MKLRKLNSGITGIIMLVTVLLFTTSCNNSDKSGKNSTTDTSTTVNTTTSDTTTTKSPTTTNSVKKTGKISLAIPPVDKSSTMEADKMGYYNYTETTPMYPGGQGSLESYITNNIEYPQEAIDNDIKGTVYVLFTIDENGNVANAKTTGTNLGYGLEEASVKVVSNMPKWTPGTIKGKNVKAWYTLPLTFRLEG